MAFGLKRRDHPFFLGGGQLQYKVNKNHNRLSGALKTEKLSGALKTEKREQKKPPQRDGRHTMSDHTHYCKKQWTTAQAHSRLSEFQVSICISPLQHKDLGFPSSISFTSFTSHLQIIPSGTITP